MAKARFKEVPFTGAEASAEAMRQINPDVVPVYPITPQTPIAQKFAQFVADGIVDSEMIRVESEHSAMSAAVGASAAGARAMTATSSAGLALMWEILGVASGSRLPIVMNVVNRALSAPINIHCDHSDSMGARDHSWIQIYCENAQEAYDNCILALKLAESVDLPVMIMQDGFITSHSVQNVRIYEDKAVKKFIGKRKPDKWLLNIDDPVTFGPLQLKDYNFETKYQQELAMDDAKKAYLKIGKELSSLTGNRYPYIEEYRSKDADAVIIAMSSTAGTTKAVIDMMRKQGIKVGLVKPVLFRPFPYEEMGKALANANYAAVFVRSFSFGANPPLYGEIMNSLYPLARKPGLQSYVFGIGGRDITEKDIENVFNDMLAGKITDKKKYISLRKS